MEYGYINVNGNEVALFKNVDSIEEQEGKYIFIDEDGETVGIVYMAVGEILIRR
jgi:hypothetical protein